MKHSEWIGDLQRVVYSVFVIALIAGAAFVFKSPARVEAQKFEKKPEAERLATATFPTSETLPFAIPDNDPAGVNLSIPVSGLTDEVRGVALNMTFDNPGAGGHTWVGDLNTTLTAPGGSPSHLIFQRVGSTTGTGGGDSSDVTGPYTFTDGTTGDFWMEAGATIGGTVAPGLYRTLACCAPAATGPGIFTDMNPVFQGPALADPRSGFVKKGGSEEKKPTTINPPDNVGNGTWTLSISDNAAGDTGRVAALSLTITTLAPTAALASIRGAVKTGKGRPISGAFVTILNTQTNETITVRTGTFGVFRFEELPVGVFYTMWVEHGRYQFQKPLQSFTLLDDFGTTFISTR